MAVGGFLHSVITEAKARVSYGYTSRLVRGLPAATVTLSKTLVHHARPEVLAPTNECQRTSSV